MSDLWYRSGDTSAPQQAILNPPVNWELSPRRATRTIYAGIALTAIGILASTILAQTVGILLTGPIVVGILAIVNGALNARSAKKRIAQQTHAQFIEAPAIEASNADHETSIGKAHKTLCQRII